jgi:hypothetical protein
MRPAPPFTFGGDEAASFWEPVAAEHVDVKKIPPTRESVHLEPLPGARPVYRSPYPCPQHLVEQERAVVEELQEWNKIEPAGPGEWNAPFFLRKEPKDNGEVKWRPLVDLSETSRQFPEKKCPLPLIADACDQLARHRWFTVVDMTAGFHQLRIHPSSRKYTAFSACGRRWQWTCLPFGLSVSPGTFHSWLYGKLEEYIQAGWCILYVDDVAVMGDTREEVLERSALVREALRQAGIKVNPKKIQHAQQRVRFLGHDVSHGAVRPLQSYVEAVGQIPLPTTQRTLDGFKGAVGWIAKFIPKCSRLMGAFVQEWHRHPNLARHEPGEALRSTFEAVQQAVMDHIALSPVLVGHGQLWLHTDACDTGMGAVLSQTVGGDRRILGVWSQAFDDTQRRYMVREKEMLAVTCALRYFHHTHYPRTVTVVTDHRSNTSGVKLNRRVNSQKLLGWLEEIQSYDVRWQYVKGSNNELADLLSRAPAPMEVLRWVTEVPTEA